MMSLAVSLILIAIVAITGVYVSWRAGLLDPAASVLLADLAHDARSAQSGRELAESDLTRALRTVFSGPDVRDSLEPGQLEPGQGADELIAELESTAHQ